MTNGLVTRWLALTAVVVLWGGSPAWAQSEAVEYYGLDALGSVRVIFDQQGNVVGRMDYGPFGENLRAAIKFPTEQFAQLARDAESGQDYAQARNYSAGTGRFNRVDPVYAGLFEPQGWNRYAYAGNNPLAFVDPEGLQYRSGTKACNEKPPTSQSGGSQMSSSEFIGHCSDTSGTAQTPPVSALPGAESWEPTEVQLDPVWELWEDIWWGATQLVDLFTGSVVTGSNVPGEDEIVPTQRPTPSTSAQVIVTAAGIGSLALPGGKGSTSRILGMRPKSLQKGFDKHGRDFGLKGNWNHLRASEYSAAIHRHVNDINTQVIVGTYRNQPAIHFVNTQTGLNVVAYTDGTYWTGFQLGGTQLQSLLRTGGFW